MRKKILPPGGPVHTPEPSAVLGCGAVTPEMQDILGSIENCEHGSQEEAEKFLRDAVGRLFIAALEQVYQQQQ